MTDRQTDRRTDGRTDGRTDRQTEKGVLRAAWSQLKTQLTKKIKQILARVSRCQNISITSALLRRTMNTVDVSHYNTTWTSVPSYISDTERLLQFNGTGQSQLDSLPNKSRYSRTHCANCSTFFLELSICTEEENPGGLSRYVDLPKVRFRKLV